MVQALKLLADAQMPTITGLGPQPGADQGVSTLGKIISVAIGVLSLIAVIYFAIQIIFAGYAHMSAQGDEKKLETAHKRLTESILGLTIVIVSLAFASLLAKLLGIDSIFNLSVVFSKLQF